MILVMMPGLKGPAYLLAAALAVCDPALAALFTPLHPQLGRYEVCTTTESLEAVVPAQARIEAGDPLDAFGTAGPYDRWAVTRLYGGRRVRVARAWAASGKEFESQTFLSPYPDATLTRLMPGTMIITFRTSCRAQAPG